MKSISTLLLCSVLVMSLKAQWSINSKVNNLISNESPIDQKTGLASVVDVNGNTYVFWSEYRSTLTGKDIYAQKLNVEGVKQWATDKIICNAPLEQTFGSEFVQIVYNGSNRIFVAWTDNRNSAGATAADIYFQCIDLNGNLQYNNVGQGTLGVPLVIAGRAQSNVKIALLSNNTEIGACWQDIRTGTGPGLNGNDIYVSKINIATGAVTPEVNLNANSIPGFSTNGSQSAPQIVPDNTGGFYVAWGDGRNSTTISGEIYMQRVNNALAPQWADNGINVTGNGKNNPSAFSMIKDGVGGAYIAWSDPRITGNSSSTQNKHDVYIMRYNAAGTALWTSTPPFLDDDANLTSGNGIRVTDCVNDQEKPLMVIDASSNVIVTWVDERVSYVIMTSTGPVTATRNDLFCQKLNATTGAFMWTSSGVVNGADCGVAVSALPNSDQPFQPGSTPEFYNFSVMPDNAGGVYVVFSDTRDPDNSSQEITGNGTRDLYIQRILNGSPNTTLSCPVNGLRIADGDYIDPIDLMPGRRNQQRPITLPLTGNDGVLVVFSDGKDNNGSVPATNGNAPTSDRETSIYAQIVNSICNLGPLSANFESINADITGNIVNVNWKVTNAQTTSSFIVERSNDGIRFETIGAIKANGVSNYEALDINPYKGINYYRVISVDISGLRKTSRIVQVQFNNKTTIVRTMPNPVTDRLNIIWADENKGKHQIRIYTNSGQLLQTQEVWVQTNSQSTVVNTKNLASGVYLVSIINENGNAIVNKTIIKQ